MKRILDDDSAGTVLFDEGSTVLIPGTVTIVGREVGRVLRRAVTC
jgi:hypothetical protein